MDAHAPFDPAIHGGILVEGKIVTGLIPQQDQDFFEAAAGFICPGQHGFGGERRALKIGDDFAWQRLHRCDKIRQSGIDRAFRHVGAFGRSGLLYEGHSPFLLDRPKTERAVGAHS